jgi:MYXO-CTERM domain-containing protein
MHAFPMRALGLTFVALAALLAEGQASAFCRETSCTCKNDTPLLDSDGYPRTNDKGMPQTTCGQPDGDCPRNEDGCVVRGAPIAWPGGCVGYSANLAGTSQLSEDDYNAAFEQAFQAWALVDCGGGRHPSIQAFKLRPTTCAASQYNSTGPNINSIYFTDDGWPVPAKASAEAKKTELDAILARTRTWSDHTTGVVNDSDIAINSAGHVFSAVKDAPDTDGAGFADDNTPYDLISVLTHEAGHFYGLDHTSDPTAVMWWQIGKGEVRRQLRPDDIAAICAIYPPDRVTTCDPTPKGGLEDSCGPKPTVSSACSSGPGAANVSAPILMSMLGLAMLWAKRRKRR